MKPLDITIIEETTLPRHECAGHCTGKNGGDGMCYHDDGTRHPVGACMQANRNRSDGSASEHAERPGI